MSFEIKSDVLAKFDVLINGGSVQQVEAGSRWKKIVVEINQLPPGEVFAIEIMRSTPAHSFEEGCFRVRKRQFKTLQLGTILV